MHISPNISRSKGKQAMKFNQVVEYYMRNIFLEKGYTKCCGKTIRRPSYKYRKILKLSCRPLAFNSYKASSKTKKRAETSLPASFSA